MIPRNRANQWHSLCLTDRVAKTVCMNNLVSVDPAIACDLSRKFVRVTQVRADGLVAFEFSIGWPEMAVELVLPEAAFEEFCIANQVQRLSDDPAPSA